MSGVGFEPMIPVFDGTKTFHAVDRAATDIGPGTPFLNTEMSLIFNVLPTWQTFCKESRKYVSTKYCETPEQSFFYRKAISVLHGKEKQRCPAANHSLFAHICFV
jgi:hypothetical protein